MDYRGCTWFCISVCILITGNYTVLQDIIFIVNMKDELSNEEANATVDFIVDIISFLNVGPSDALFAIFFAGTGQQSAAALFTLSSFDNRDNWMAAIEQLKPLRTSAYTSQPQTYYALYATQALQTPSGRETASRTIILIAGIPSQSSSQTISAANMLKSSQIKIFSVGFGDHFQNNDNELNQTASHPDYYYYASDYTKFCDVLPSLVRQLDDNTNITDADGCPISNSSHQESDYPLDLGLIIGCVIGGLVLIKSVTLVLVYYTKNRSKKRKNSIQDSHASKHSNISLQVQNFSREESGYISTCSEATGVSAPTRHATPPHYSSKIQGNNNQEFDRNQESNDMHVQDMEEWFDKLPVQEGRECSSDATAIDTHISSGDIQLQRENDANSLNQSPNDRKKEVPRSGKHIRISEPDYEERRHNYKRKTSRRESVISSIWKSGMAQAQQHQHRVNSATSVQITIKQKPRTALWAPKQKSEIAEAFVMRKNKDKKVKTKMFREKINQIIEKNKRRQHKSSTFSNELWFEDFNSNPVAPASHLQSNS